MSAPRAKLLAFIMIKSRFKLFKKKKKCLLILINIKYYFLGF